MYAYIIVGAGLRDAYGQPVDGRSRCAGVAARSRRSNAKDHDQWASLGVTGWSTTDAGFVEHIRRTSQTIYYPVGTCKVASHRDPLGVVDNALGVRGVEGLRVVDASVFPLENHGPHERSRRGSGKRAADVIRKAGKEAYGRIG